MLKMMKGEHVSMKKTGVFLYAVFSYLFAMSGQIAFILYISPWDLMPWYIDRGTADISFGAVALDLLLIALFGLQHTLMARKGIKRKLFGALPESIERSTYVWLSGALLWLIILFFQPFEGYLWDLRSSIWGSLMSAFFVAAWLFSTVATFVINHFELFGLQQGWHYLRGVSPKEIPFEVKLFYRVVRHPIQLGVLAGLWATPAMGYGHLLLSSGLSLYILIGLYYEERDLEHHFGDAYRDYKKKVAKLIPLLY